MIRLLCVLILIMALFIGCSDMGKKAPVVNNPPDTTVSYSADIQPIFNSRCVGCHVGAIQGGLRLDNYSFLLLGGNSGPVVVPFEPDSSILVQRIEGILPRMPLVGDPLTQEQIDLIRQWIVEGAEDN